MHLTNKTQNEICNFKEASKSLTEVFSMLYKHVIHRNVQHGILSTFAVLVSKVQHSVITNRAVEISILLSNNEVWQ